MADQPIISSPDEIIGPAIEQIVALRPQAGPAGPDDQGFIYTGVYSHLIAGWRAQAAVEWNRIAKAVANNRLATSEGGDELRNLVSSEFTALPDTSATKSIGEVTLQRAAVTKGLVGGTIRSGAKFARPAQTTPIVLPAAEYVTIEDAPVNPGQVSVTIKIQATTAGSIGNTPIFDTGLPTDLSISDELFDTFQVVSYSAGGGSDSWSDQDVIRFAQAFAVGQYAPTNAALIYGAVSFGARHVAIQEDPITAISRVYVADSSWGSSPRWASAVQQFLYDNLFVGFGCKINVLPVINRLASLSAAIVLRDKSFSGETSEIDAAVRGSARSYFDDRQDWYVFKTLGLRASLVRSDDRVRACPTVVLQDPNGNVIQDTVLGTGSQLPPVHYFLADNGMSISYLNPGSDTSSISVKTDGSLFSQQSVLQGHA